MGEATQKNRLVLCFDGTSNSFQANSGDTNIVKIYEMLNRETNDQYHYYQRKFPFRSASLEISKWARYANEAI